MQAQSTPRDWATAWVSFLLRLLCHCSHLNGGVFFSRGRALHHTGRHSHNRAPTGGHLRDVLDGRAQSGEGEQLEGAHHFHHSVAVLDGCRAQDGEVGGVWVDLHCVGKSGAGRCQDSVSAQQGRGWRAGVRGHLRGALPQSRCRESRHDLADRQAGKLSDWHSRSQGDLCRLSQELGSDRRRPRRGSGQPGAFQRRRERDGRQGHQHVVEMLRFVL